jgi:crotonobetainyl-CoA:carnitine CoA-transferase CaiB-like acyl-CoA transferase
MTKQALSHLKVLELCNMVAGPYCGKLLADLGAEVIKVEPPNGGDDARRRGPFLEDKPHPERSGLFLYLNTNKLGVTLDMRTPTGRRILRQLSEKADILIEDNPPSFMNSLGLGYDDLKKLNHQLVMTSLTPFGQTGPYRDYKAHRLNSFHAGGEGYLVPIQSPDLTREPLMSGCIQADCVCGLGAALATLAGYYHMRASGSGQHVDMSKQDMLMTMALLEIALFANTGAVRSRIKRPLLMPIPMKCRDGYIHISALTDREWNDIVEFMGNPEWAKDERYALWLRRHLLGDEITPRIQSFMEQFDKQDLFHKLQSKALAAAPVNTAEDLVKSEQMEARGFFSDIEHPEIGSLKYPTAGYKLSETPWQARRAAPLLGEHNELVYCDRLGYTKDDLVKLRESGCI